MGTFAFLKKWVFIVVNWSRAFFKPTDLAWKWSGRTIITFGVLFFLAEFFTEIIPDFSLSKLLGFTVPYIILLLTGVGIYFALHLIKYVPSHIRWAALLLLPFAVFMFGGIWGDKGSLIFISSSVLSLCLLVASSAILHEGGFKIKTQKKATFFFLVGAFGVGAIATLLFGTQDHPNPHLKSYELADKTLGLPDPSQPGEFKVKTLTYGSGKDLHRPEYGEDVTIKTTSVNGNALVDRWSGPVGWARSLYWGFDDKTLPRQGRVWMPEGDGPFPLVLIVHGNHGMEDFSDPGYAYLGELFASRGYIFTSVDENFINSSWADRIHPFERGIGRENDARGWMLLQHLSLWRDWMQDPSHPLYGKADMENIALMGHSRGGEAVGIAAAFNTLDHYPDDATLRFNFNFNIKGVVAIAPVDGQYRPRGRPTPMKDMNYFTVHGSGDGDVDSFAGTVQYNRAKFSGDAYKFKSSLYIHEANHGQFNTGWGRNDFGGFSGWFLDTDNLISGEDQRQIGKVYFGAFLDATLKGKTEYLPIFKDARFAHNWLPNEYYINNFADSEDIVLASFDEDIEASTGTIEGVSLRGQNLSQWREEWIDMIYADNDTHILRLAWDSEVTADTASYEIDLPSQNLLLSNQNSLTFGAAHGGSDTLPKDFEKPEGAEEEKSEDKALGLDWTITLVDGTGQEAALLLSEDHPLFEKIKTQTRRINFLYYLPDSEAIMRRYIFPLERFKEINPNLDFSSLSKIRFDFDQSNKGAVYLDNIGFSKN